MFKALEERIEAWNSNESVVLHRASMFWSATIGSTPSDESSHSGRKKSFAAACRMFSSASVQMRYRSEQGFGASKQSLSKA